MKISQKVIDDMIEHARRDLPNECCGLVGGREGELMTAYPMRNEFESPLRYQLHSGDNLRVSQEMDAAGEETLAVYHSHTKTEAYPSQTDVNIAQTWPELLYLIVSLENADSPVVKGFWLKEEKVAFVDLETS